MSAEFARSGVRALFFGRLAVQRVGDSLCAGRYCWTDDRTQRSAIALSATSAQRGELAHTTTNRVSSPGYCAPSSSR